MDPYSGYDGSRLLSSYRMHVALVFVDSTIQGLLGGVLNDFPATINGCHVAR